MDSLKIKACNPDNTVETSQLVGLFRDSYGDQFPFSSVYDKDYWSRQAGVRFLSVLAMRKFRVVGHLGARPESANPRVVQICFPACAAEIRDEAVECAKEAWSILHAVSSRKNWSAVYFSSFSDLELMQRIGTEALGVRSTAILPGYIPIQNPRCNRSARRSRDGGRSHAVVAQRLLQNPAASPSTPLYIPERHAEISRELLTGIGMVAAAGRINIESSQNAAALPADAPALQSHFFKEWGSAYYVVRPTLLTSFQDSLFEVSRGGESHPFIFVDARDAACPRYSDFLEESGFSFCGILPNLFDTEALVYARLGDLSVEAESFVCSTAQKLARYISETESHRSGSKSVSLPSSKAKYAPARL